MTTALRVRKVFRDLRVSRASGSPAVTGLTPAGDAMTVSAIGVMNVGGQPQVTFHVATDSGPVTDLTFDACRFYLADLVPAGTATATQGTWASDYFERWAYERSNTTGAVFDDSDAANGNYTFTFVTGFGSADALAEAPEYSATHQQRLVIRISGTEGVTQNTVGIFDMTAVPADGAAATEVAAANQRMYASIDGCKNCHGPQMEGAAHANGYLDTRACVICHSPIGHYGDEMVPDEAYLSVFIHKIHSALPVAGFLDRHNNNGLGGEGYVDVTYPENRQELHRLPRRHQRPGRQLGNPSDHRGLYLLPYGDYLHWRQSDPFRWCTGERQLSLLPQRGWPRQRGG